MSSALKCNRCGTYFDPKDPFEGEIMSIKNPRLYEYDDINKNTFKLYDPDMYECPNIDLCPMCTNDFMIFMNGEDFCKASEFEMLVHENAELARKNAELKNELEMTKNMLSKEDTKNGCTVDSTGSLSWANRIADYDNIDFQERPAVRSFDCRDCEKRKQVPPNEIDT